MSLGASILIIMDVLKELCPSFMLISVSAKYPYNMTNYGIYMFLSSSKISVLSATTARSVFVLCTIEIVLEQKRHSFSQNRT